jgi:hypothetical protein
LERGIRRRRRYGRKATIAYASPDGPAILKLGRKDDATSITLVVKDPGVVAKAGITPKRGQAKVLFGNINDAAATITFNSKKRSTSPPVPVSKIRTVQRSIYRPANTNIPSSSRASRCRAMRLNSASRSLGLMIGPGGVLALQAY